jgi:HK97 family phage prohead protease
MEYKLFTLDEFKAEEGARRVSGYGSIFGNVDSYGDIVAKGAFASSIASRKPAMLWQHKSDAVPGVWDAIEERAKGLYLEGTLADTPLGNEAYALLKMGAISGLSIGYGAKRASIDPKKNTRTLEEVDLYEVSFVTFPANERATVTGVKSALDGLRFEDLHTNKKGIEAALRDAGASNSVASYIASLIPAPAQRDAEGKELMLSITKAMQTLKG